jgi:hypothetical protein
MAAPKTRRHDASVDDFLNRIENERVRNDCRTITGLMQKATGAKPEMWGANIVGFGTYRYKYASGVEVDWMLTAFSPRKHNITLYVMPGFDRYDELTSQLGKHSSGKSCLYIKRLADIHLPTLEKLVKASVRHMRARRGE